MGGGSSNGGGVTEAPNTLVSDSLLKITDLLCEGPISGFAYMGGAFGYDPLTATYFNDVQFRNVDGSYNFNTSGQGFAFSYTLGTPNQLAMSGFEKVTMSVPLPSNTVLSNPPPGAGSPKNLIVTFNTNQFPDANTLVVNYRVPALYTTSNGTVNGFEVDVQLSCSLNGGAFLPMDGGNQFVGKNTVPYFRTYVYTLPISNPPQSFYQWTLQFVKTNQDVDSVAVSDGILVDSVSIVSTSSYNYPNSVLVGLYIDANQFGSVPARSYLIQGLMIDVPNGYTPTQYIPGLAFTRQFFINDNDGLIGGIPGGDPTVYNGITTGMVVNGDALAPNTIVTEIDTIDSFIGIKPNATGTNHNSTLTFSNPTFPTRSAVPAIYPDVWDGTFQSGVWTDNPAWVFYDLVTNTRYGLGQYININNIDIWTLYQISQYCDELVDNGQGLGIMEPQFSCNVYIKEQEDAYNMLLNMASVFRGMLYYANGTIRANMTDNKVPVFNYTNANVIGGNFSYASTARSARHNSVRVKYTDPSNLYRDNYVLVQDNQGILQYGNNPKEISAFACTSIGQATRVANWIMTTERLRTETVSFQVGMDGLYIRPGDVFYLYDNFRMNRSQGGRIQSFDTGQRFITLDRAVNLDSGCIYALSCLVAAPNFDSPSGITGSNEIPLIRNPQIQAREVLDADLSGVTTLQVDQGFSGLSLNAVWILTCSGVYTANYVPSVFEQAPLYECLTVTQSAPGILDITALNYNTGINYSVNTGFTTIMNPVNSGDPTPPPPPSNFTGQLITGNLSNGSFYSYLNLTWSVAPSANVASYVVSGELAGPGNGYGVLANTSSTGTSFFAGVTGDVHFTLQSLSKGGVYSSPVFTDYLFPGAPGVDPAQIRFYLLPDGFGDLEQISVWYNRPSPAVTNTRVFYATGIAGTGSFREVADQSFYPALGVSLSGISSSGSTAYFTSSSYDAPYNLFSQTTSQQANNSCLFLLDDELMSVGTVTGLGSNQYAFTMSRGVMGTFAAPHAGGISGWVTLASNIDSFTDQSIVNVFNATGYDTGVATRYFQVENNTATLQGAIVPALPGLSYVIPNPLPDPPSNLSYTLPGGPIVHLTWTGPQDTDIEQYQVYRSTAPFTVFTGVAATTNTFYDDVAVSVGNTYEYYVQTEATNTQQSTASNTVTAIPTGFVPSGVSVLPPLNPSAATLTTSGNYLAADGTLLAFLTFSAPGGNVGDAYTTLQYTKHGAPLVGMTIAGQTTGTTPQLLTIYDLSPNVSYDVATQAQSNFGIFSPGIILANSSPFLTPSTGGSVGAPGGRPTTPTNVAISGGLGNTANFVAVTWAPNPELNVEEYGIYRDGSTNPSFSPSQPSRPIAFASTTQYVDATVTGGSTYAYWVSAYNRSEQQSSTQAASPSKITVQGAPAAAGTPVLATSGFYYAIDGTVLNSFSFNVPALPAYAFGQQLLYGRNNTPATMTVGGDTENAGSTTVTLNDLSPGGSGYYVALKPYSQHGVPGSITFANGGNPITGAGRITAVTPPTGLQIGPAVYGSSPPVPPQYGNIIGASPQPPNGIGVLAAITGSWISSPDVDIQFYEWFAGGVFFPPSPTAVINYQNTVPASISYAVAYNGSLGGAAIFMWIRAINKSGGISAWCQPGASTFFLNNQYAGDLGTQSFSSTELASLNVSQGGATVTTRSATIQQPFISVTVTVVSGPVAAVNYNYSLAGMGFTVAPEVGIINLDGASHGAQYRYSASTSTNAVISIFRFDGTADITNGETFDLQAYFQQNY